MDAITEPIINWTVYKVTNPEGQVYIGETKNLKKRIRRYRGKEAGTQSALLASLHKHGFENHKIEVIETFDSTESYSNDKEIFWIRTYMSNSYRWPEIKGLNQCDGGKGTKGYRHSEETNQKNRESKVGFRHTEEARMKISEAGKGNQYNLGRKHSPETIAKRVAANKGRPYRSGYELSQEHKDAIRKGHLGKVLPPEVVEKYRRLVIERFGVPVSQYTLDGVFIQDFKTMADAYRTLKMGKKTIENAVRGIYTERAKFIFKYKNK